MNGLLVFLFPEILIWGLSMKANRVPSTLCSGGISNQAPVPANWPETGRIVFSNMQICHCSSLPLILKGVTKDI